VGLSSVATRWVNMVDIQQVLSYERPMLISWRLASVLSSALLLVTLPSACGSDAPAFKCETTTAECQQIVAGNYAGTYKGDGAGTWEVVIDLQGLVTGSGKSSSSSAQFTLSGTADPNGSVILGSVLDSGGTGSFQGQLLTDGSLVGTWQVSSASGTWRGSRISQ